jgi:hypothetical protein
MDSLLEEFKCSCGDPLAVDVIHKSNAPCMHKSGLTVQRWNWPYKTPEERELVARWFKKQEKQPKQTFERATL